MEYVALKVTISQIPEVHYLIPFYGKNKRAANLSEFTIKARHFLNGEFLGVGGVSVSLKKQSFIFKFCVHHSHN